MVKNSVVSIFVLVTISVLSMWIFARPASSAPSLQPTLTPTPCATPASTSGRGRAVTNSPGCSTTALSSKAAARLGGGGDGRLVPCEGVIAPEGTLLFGVYPDRYVYPQKPHIVNDIMVEICDWSSTGEFTIQLRDPSGRLVKEERAAYFTFDFPQNPIYGEYVLNIVGQSRSITHNLFVTEYTGPLVLLTDPVTGEAQNVTLGQWPEVNRSHGMRVQYQGFMPEATLEVALYSLIGEGDGNDLWVVVDTWQLIVDENGQFYEQLDFPSNIKGGQYLLVACDTVDCDLSYSLLAVEPLGPPNGVIVPLLAWQMFNLPVAQTQARVDPISAWDNLRMREGPGTSFSVVRSLPPNSLVTVLDGPESRNGSPWYQVRDEASGREGWVNGNYLVFDIAFSGVLPENQQRLSFPTSGTTATVSALLSPGSPQAYRLRARAGQDLIVRTNRADANVTVLDSSLTRLIPSVNDPGRWVFALPQNTDYILLVEGRQRTTITVEIPPQ